MLDGFLSGAARQVQVCCSVIGLHADKQSLLSESTHPGYSAIDVIDLKSRLESHTKQYLYVPF
ncbi:MAG: hypothetical protein PVH74_01660 [Desulfobacterales bacterium]